MDDGRGIAADVRATISPPAALGSVDPSVAYAVDEAIAGDGLDQPEAQPERELSQPRDFASFYIRTRTSLGYQARRFLTDDRDVDEVVQETFIRLFLAMPELQTERQALAFSRRVLTNLCIDRYRIDRRRPRLFDMDAAGVAELPGDEFADHPVLEAEDAAVVRRALSLLSPLHRAALVKREIEEKPLPQIAAELDIPEESVKHVLHRARRSLRRLLVGSAVDPDRAMTFGEVAAAANRRAGERMLHSAHLIVLVVFAVCAAATVVRAGQNAPAGAVGALGGSPTRAAAPSGDGPLGLGRTVAPHPRAGHRRKSSGTAAGVTSTGHAAVPPTSHARAWSGRPTIDRVAPPAAGQPRQPSRPPAVHKTAYALAGMPVTGAATVVPLSRAVSAGSTISVSKFVAPTALGTFALQQTVTQAPSATVSVQVSAALLPAAAPALAVTPADAGSPSQSASVQRDPDGTLSIELSAAVPNLGGNASAQPATVPQTLTPIAVHAVVAPDLLRVESETVTVGPTYPVVPPSTSPVPSAAPQAAAGEPAQPTTPGSATPGATTDATN